ncbi:selenoprotein H-like [Teleopsis dalmanni]|uniref:selenoprotein H-like n=1 Tax=Teleopsis dalmanni TaxID=139649 RepID=UPI0018CEF1B9|nr:selenoprotein H-like [Teleopsis dalmanni]XP_037943911.1 selenoprotein H-like [Teleopsis dalmanni]
MPKKGGKKQKKGKKIKDIDWAADENFSKTRSVIYIEHTTECPIFQRKAEEFREFLEAEVPEREFVLIRNGNGKKVPRLGAFEISFSQNARTSQYDIWSGIDKGPPRRDKFPESFELVMPEVRKILKKFYAEAKQEEEED